MLSPFPSSFIFISLCGALVALVPVFLSGLSCTAYYMVAFLALRVLHVVVPLFISLLFVFCFLVFCPESLPGDDDIKYLQATFTPASFCLLSSLFVLFCFFRPCSCPVCFYGTSYIIVTTAGFINNNVCDFVLFWCLVFICLRLIFLRYMSVRYGFCSSFIFGKLTHRDASCVYIIPHYFI